MLPIARAFFFPLATDTKDDELYEGVQTGWDLPNDIIDQFKHLSHAESNVCELTQYHTPF